MKKRRILLGLFMAAGAALSLTSCVKEDPNKGGTQQVTTFDVTFNTNGGSDVAKQTVESGKKVTKPADPTKTATKTTAYTFAGWFKDAALTQSFNFETETITAATTLYAKWTETAVAADKFTVKFMNGTTELTALKQEVNENGKVTKPARTSLPTQEGKRFDYWSADGGVTPYNFDDVVISDLELSAVFVDANEFDTLAASANKVVAVDFYDDAVATATEVSFASETIALSTNNTDNRITNDNKFSLAKDALAIDFGNKKITASTTGVLTVYFEASFQAIKNGEAFFQLDGSSANKQNTEVFGLRVTSGDNKGKIGYRLDGGADVASTVTVEVNKTYKIKLVFDLADGKASYFVDGTAAVENVTININAVRGLKFTAKNDNSSKKTVDNIVATFETKAKSELATAKEAAIAALDAKTLSTDNAIKAAEEAVIAETKTTINAATTVEAVNTAKEAAIAYVDATKYTLTVKAYTAANTAATGTTDIVKVYKTTDTVSLADVSFTGFTVDKFYTDATLATEYTPAALTANVEVAAKVAAASVAGSWSAEDAELGQSAIAADTQLTSIVKTAGNVTAKYNTAADACIGYEVKQNGAGSLVVVVPTGKNVTVTFLLRSTSSSNTSDGIALYNGETVVVPTSFTPDADDSDSTNTDGVMLIKGTKDATVVYTLAAGTYTLKNNASTTNNRGFRVFGVTVAEVA